MTHADTLANRQVADDRGEARSRAHGTAHAAEPTLPGACKHHRKARGARLEGISTLQRPSILTVSHRWATLVKSTEADRWERGVRGLGEAHRLSTVLAGSPSKRRSKALLCITGTPVARRLQACVKGGQELVVSRSERHLSLALLPPTIVRKPT